MKLLQAKAELAVLELVVQGAGSAEINGFYVRRGDRCGKPKYEKLGTDAKGEQLGYGAGSDGGASVWFMWTGTGTPAYRVASAAALPPANGWVPCGGVKAPAPTVQMKK